MKANILLMVVAMVASQEITAQSFKVVKSEDVDLLAFERFTVVKGEFMTPKDERVMTDEDLFVKMKKAIITELELRGYRHVEDSTEQFVVTYVAGAFRMMDSGNVGPLGSTPVSDPAEIDQSRSWSRDFKEGLLEIDVTAPNSTKVIWKTTGTLSIEGSDGKQLDGAVYKALKKFPNRKKKRR